MTTPTQPLAVCPSSDGQLAARQESAGPASVPRQEHPTLAVEVPERPALAANVQAIGEMQGAGFTEPQWLVQRDGRFLQLSELLYRVAEHANGERTLEEIAVAVTHATDWHVSADDVRHLLRTKLVPLGLIAGADRSVISRGHDAIRSPLQVNMRRTLLGPRVLAPISGVLQALYAPPLLIPMLLAIAVAEVWLYFVHGITGSLDALIYRPGLLLVVLPIVLISSLVHELGHAAGLRYGGGHVRGIGMGFYLFSPTFYTDVTDAYRLNRWARLRTDLGGFYFHLLFALVLVAFYLLTGEESLIIVVLIINLNILYQCLPFTRLDGYWALADLTGIPDFFSQIGPFLRSVLPVPGLEGTKLPNLQPWVRVVFTAYILLTVPVLAFLFFMMVVFLPERALVMGDSLVNQVRGFTAAQRAGDVLGIAASLLNILVIALLMVGLAYILFSLSRSPIRALWRWSAPTPARRLAGALGAMAAVALVGWVWIPQLPYTAWAWTVPAGPPGVETYEVTQRSHVAPPIYYEQVPPVGGNHAPIWQNCGFYDAPILNETAVHSLEHGAVWITYRQGLPSEQVDTLRRLTRGQTYVLVSPSTDLPAAVVANAWGRQLRLESVDDPRLHEFVRAFRDGRQAPEPGAPCTGGIGQPE